MVCSDRPRSLRRWRSKAARVCAGDSVTPSPSQTRRHAHKPPPRTRLQRRMAPATRSLGAHRQSPPTRRRETGRASSAPSAPRTSPPLSPVAPRQRPRPVSGLARRERREHGRVARGEVVTGEQRALLGRGELADRSHRLGDLGGIGDQGRTGPDQLVAPGRHRRRDRTRARTHHPEVLTRRAGRCCASHCAAPPRRRPCPGSAWRSRRLRLRNRHRVGAEPGGTSLTTRPVSRIRSSSAAWPAG